jgi:uncharacterized membrane protein (UPF0127 family)
VLRSLIVFALVSFASCRRNSPSEPSSTNAQQDPGRGSGSGTTPAGAAGNHEGLPPLTGPNVVFRPAGQPPVAVRVEVQRTEAEHARGLMYRRDLDEMAGMIFVFREPAHQTFWMRNTYLPLDMIFITADRHVLGVVRNATPMTDDPREVEGDSQYVLEVNAGWADRHHVGTGTPVEFVNVPPALE